jgi:hypothetical protein
MPVPIPASSTLDWITALGTLGAVGVSVYVGVLREQLRRPSLSLAFQPDSSDAMITRAPRTTRTVRDLTDEREDDEEAYLRLRVLNKRKRMAAEDAEVTITGVREITTEPGRGGGDLRIDGQSLVFSNSVPETTKMTVSPGGVRRVDVAHASLSDRRKYRAEIAVWPRPPDRGQRSIFGGAVELELTVTARNADAVRYVLELHFSGRPVDRANIWEELRIKNFRKLTATRPTAPR